MIENLLSSYFKNTKLSRYLWRLGMIERIAPTCTCDRFVSLEKLAHIEGPHKSTCPLSRNIQTEHCPTMLLQAKKELAKDPFNWILVEKVAMLHVSLNYKVDESYLLRILRARKSLSDYLEKQAVEMNRSASQLVVSIAANKHLVTDNQCKQYVNFLQMGCKCSNAAQVLLTDLTALWPQTIDRRPLTTALLATISGGVDMLNIISDQVLAEKTRRLLQLPWLLLDQDWPSLFTQPQDIASDLELDDSELEQIIREGDVDDSALEQMMGKAEEDTQEFTIPDPMLTGMPTTIAPLKEPIKVQPAATVGFMAHYVPDPKQPITK